MACVVTLKDLACFHHIDREVYARLVINLGLDPNLSKKIVAFWYWLERKGYTDFINNMLLLPDQEFKGIALEAIICLDCLNKDWYIATSSSAIDRTISLPIMCELVSQDFSIGKLYADRASGMLYMEIFLKDVCDRVFFDIVPRNLVNGFQVRPALVSGFQIPHGFQIQQALTNGLQVQSIVASGAEPVQHTQAEESQVHQNCYMNSKVVSSQEDNATQDSDRTLFITFSKGHPISKEELRDLIVRKFGNCVEAIHMRVEPEPLFARVVVNSVSAMTKILGDKDMVKLSINGKDVRLRRFIPNT